MLMLAVELPLHVMTAGRAYQDEHAVWGRDLNSRSLGAARPARRRRCRGRDPSAPDPPPPRHSEQCRVRAPNSPGNRGLALLWSMSARWFGVMGWALYS